MGTPHFLTGSGINTAWKIVEKLRDAVSTETIQLIQFETEATTLLDKMLTEGAKLCHDKNVH